MSDEGLRFLEAMGFDGPTVGPGEGGGDVLRAMIEKVQQDPSGALTCYNSDGEALAVMIHPLVWNYLLNSGYVIPTSMEEPFRGQ